MSAGSLQLRMSDLPVERRGHAYHQRRGHHARRPARPPPAGPAHVRWVWPLRRRAWDVSGGDRGHKGAAALELTEPLLPQVDVRSTYPPGAAVTLVGLTTASLNGETGWVAQALDGATGRIAVRLKPLRMDTGTPI